MNPQSHTKKFVDECFILTKTFISGNKTNWFLFPQLIFNKFSEDEFVKVLKDPIWLKVSKSFRWWGLKNEDVDKIAFSKKAGATFNLVVRLFQTGHAYSDHVVKYADGILLRAALKHCEDFRLRKLSLRGLKSKDYRVRKIAVELCPVTKLNSMINDSRKEVRLAVIKRLGIHNVAKKVIDDDSIDIRLSAALCLDRMDVIEDILEKESDKAFELLNHSSKFKKTSWSSQKRLLKVIAKLPKKKVVCNLNLKDSSKIIQDLLEAKLYDKNFF